MHPAITSNIIKEYLEYSIIDDIDVSKIFKKDNKIEFHNELNILMKIRNIPDYIFFTTAIKSASKFKYKNIYYHKNIDIEYSKYDDNVYQIIFEYGGTPINKINYNISFSKFLQYFKQLLKGVKSLQDNNIVHRDIKPTNCLITDKKLNLIDFGLACDVNNVYKNDKDTEFILSYMYMYHPPEFYIIHLLYKQQKICDDFIKNLDNVFNNLLPDNIDKFYYEHYYRYFFNEPYNIFAYKKAFHKFYTDIKDKNIKKIEDILTIDFAFKTDIFSLSFILKSLKSHIIFNNIHQRQTFNILYYMMYALNPYDRCNINEIIDYIEIIYN